MTHYVYYVFCSLTGALLYIGRSHQPERRRRDHQARFDRPLRLGLSQRFKDLGKACEAERDAIRRHDPPLNQRIASSPSSFGQVMSAETRAKLAKAQTGRKHSDASRERRRQSLMGHPVSDESRLKMKAAQQARRRREALAHQ